jgi:hypothetical protein
MYIAVNKPMGKTNKKIYDSILLRESYRENGKVKKRTIANLSHCSPEEIAAMKLALKHKESLCVLGSIKESVTIKEGLFNRSSLVCIQHRKAAWNRESIGK